MPVTWTVDAGKSRVHVTVTGRATRDQGGAAAAAIVSDPGFAPTFGFVMDAHGCAGPDFVRDVVNFFATHRDKFRGARVAIVMSLGAVAGKSETAEILAESGDLPITIQTFWTYRAADRWLASGA